ncbi:MAG: hypothetical protein KDE22_09025 [Rhodobacterales bacterium]|nr:hypothetical protein [Rhodobacterales bacterium]
MNTRWIKRLALTGVLAGVLAAGAGRAALAEDFTVVDSKKELETRVAALLKTRLNVSSTLNVVGESPEDLRMATRFRPDPEAGTPAIAVYADTAIMGRDAEGVKVQVLAFFSVPAVTVPEGRRGEFLEWTNTWNQRLLPSRILLRENRPMALVNATIYARAPMSEDQVLASFLQSARVWNSALKSLREAGLVVEDKLAE